MTKSRSPCRCQASDSNGKPGMLFGLKNPFRGLKFGNQASDDETTKAEQESQQQLAAEKTQPIGNGMPWRAWKQVLHLSSSCRFAHLLCLPYRQPKLQPLSSEPPASLVVPVWHFHLKEARKRSEAALSSSAPTTAFQLVVSAIWPSCASRWSLTKQAVFCVAIRKLPLALGCTAFGVCQVADIVSSLWSGQCPIVVLWDLLLTVCLTCSILRQWTTQPSSCQSWMLLWAKPQRLNDTNKQLS